MANKVVDGELLSFGVCVRDPYLCPGPCDSREVTVAEIFKALTEANGTHCFSVLCSRRVRRGTFSAALSLAVVRSGSGSRRDDPKELAAGVREDRRTKRVSLSLHNEIYYQAHDAARQLLGWSEPRVCDYEQKALARAEDVAKHYGQRFGRWFVARHWPFQRQFCESSVEYVARLNSLKWTDTPDGPQFQCAAERVAGQCSAEQFAESIRQSGKDLD